MIFQFSPVVYCHGAYVMIGIQQWTLSAMMSKWENGGDGRGLSYRKSLNRKYLAMLEVKKSV